jgi:adenylate cyclase
MSVHDEISSAIDSIFTTSWDERSGQVVPETDDVKLKDGAVLVDATYLYADLAGSTQIAQQLSAKSAARVIRAYLNMASRVIKYKGGHIRSFDGDRVMAIFIGDSKNSNAARAALGINYYVRQVLSDRVSDEIPKTKDIGWTFNHGIGVDTGQALIVRGGVRNDNDLVSIGRAPNVAAKLSDKRVSGFPTHITRSVYNMLNDAVKQHADGRYRFQDTGTTNFGGNDVEIMRSDWYWRPDAK